VKTLALLATLATQDGDLLAQCGLADCPVQLTAGRTYMLKASETEGDGTGGYLIDPAGDTVLFVTYNGDGSYDKDVQAAYSATYTVRADGSAWVYLYDDCPASLRTLCVMGPATPAKGASTSKDDVDVFRVRLVAGHAYTWSYGAPAGLQVSLSDSAGRQLRANHLGSLRYRAPATGAYYLAVARSHGAPYTVTMR
jgi:hypothetical protein